LKRQVDEKKTKELFLCQSMLGYSFVGSKLGKNIYKFKNVCKTMKKHHASAKSTTEQPSKDFKEIKQ